MCDHQIRKKKNPLIASNRWLLGNKNSVLLELISHYCTQGAELQTDNINCSKCVTSRISQKISRNVSTVLNTSSVSNLRPLDSAITVAQHQQQISLQSKQVYKVFKSHWGKRSLRDVQINQEWGRPPRERGSGPSVSSIQCHAKQLAWTDKMRLYHALGKQRLIAKWIKKINWCYEQISMWQVWIFLDWSVQTGQSCFPAQKPIMQIVFLANAEWHS